MLLLNEVLDVKLTAIFTTIIFNAYPVFGVLYSILFRDLDNWRAIFIIIGIIHLICVILLFFFVEESPRFYYVKNEIEKMENVLLKISTINNKDTNEIKKYLRGNEKDKDKDKVKVKDKVKDKNNNNFNLIDNENKSINEKSSFLNNNSYEVNLNIEERQNQNNLINDEIILNDGKKLIKN